METKDKNVTIKVIEAKDGYSIVKKGEELATAYGSKTVYLGVRDSVDNYTEVRDEDLQKAHDEYEAQQRLNTPQEAADDVEYEDVTEEQAD